MRCEQEGCAKTAKYTARALPARDRDNRLKNGCTEHIGTLIADAPANHKWMVKFLGERVAAPARVRPS